MKKSVLHTFIAAAFIALIQACNPESNFTTNSQEHISSLAIQAENESSLPQDSNLVVTLSGDSIFIHALPNSWLSPRFNLHECRDHFKDFQSNHDSLQITLMHLSALELSSDQKSAINLALDSFNDETEEIVKSEYSAVVNLNFKAQADVAKWISQYMMQQISYITLQQKISTINTDYRNAIQQLHYGNKELLFCLSAYRKLLNNIRNQTTDKQWLRFFQLEKEPVKRH